MPKYSFECCTCNLRFERNLKMGEHTVHPCPSCQDDAPLVMEGFAFAFGTTQGSTSGNTGVHDLDYPTADKAVGRSADERWDYHQAREAAKNEARKVGNTHALMRSHGPGYIEYRPLTEKGLDARRHLARDMLQRVRAKSTS